MNKLYALALLCVGFVIGEELQLRLDRRRATAVETRHRQELEERWHTAFHSGWDSAESSPSIQYEHYKKFKAQMEEGART